MTACKSFDDVLVSHFPTLYEAQEGDKKDKIRTLQYVCAAIVDYLGFKNRRNTMNDIQVAETATLIIEEFPYLHLDDMKLFVRRLKVNAYGEVYDLDGQAFIGWLRKYVEEKREAQYSLIKQRERQAKEKRDKEIEEYMNTPEGKAEKEKIQNRLSEIQNKFADKIKPNKHSRDIEHREKSPQQYRIEAIRKRVIAENMDRVMRDYPESYMEVMNGLIDEALKAEGLKA